MGRVCRWKECCQAENPTPPCSGEISPQLMKLSGEQHVHWFCEAHGSLWLELAATNQLELEEDVILLTEDEALAASIMLR